MSSLKLKAGSLFPEVAVDTLDAKEVQLKNIPDDADWRMVVVYRGLHCPLCTRYLNQLNELLPEFKAQGIDVVAVSADSKMKATEQLAQVNPDYPVGYGLTVEQMKTLGLYVSEPRSAEETDAPFAEPGLFIINHEGRVQIVDIANAPFCRPDLNSILAGIKFIRNPENNYPIRGTLV
jgi:peroxiredoxin